MIVKITREFVLNGRTYRIGEVVDTAPDNAARWVKGGLAVGMVQEKTMESIERDLSVPSSTTDTANEVTTGYVESVDEEPIIPPKKKRKH